MNQVHHRHQPKHKLLNLKIYSSENSETKATGHPKKQDAQVETCIKTVIIEFQNWYYVIRRKQTSQWKKNRDSILYKTTNT